MLNIIKSLFVPNKDYAGRHIDLVIDRLAAQTQTKIYDWSYLVETSVYENTRTGQKVYPHELTRYAA